MCNAKVAKGKFHLDHSVALAIGGNNQMTKILAHNRNRTPARLEKLEVFSANMVQLEKMIPGHGGDEQEDKNEFDASVETGLDQPAGADGRAGGSDGAENEGGAGEGHARTAVGCVAIQPCISCATVSSDLYSYVGDIVSGVDG